MNKLMKKHMKHMKKYIIVFLTVMMSSILFCVTAFAQAEVTPESDSGSSSPSSSSSVSSRDSSSSSTSEEPWSSSPEGGNGNVSAPPEDDTVPVKLDYNDGSKIKIINVEPGSLVKDLPVPSRKGYFFDYWTMNQARVSSSFEIYSEITLTAQWEKSTASSRKASSYSSVDTHQQQVEQAASQAQAVISDPDVLSSEDWNSILSTGQESSGGAEASSSQASSSAQGGGGSWLFPAGIALIVLSACGVGTFVYLQFFSGSGPRGPRSGSGPEEPDDNMEFTDISSNSAGPYPAPPPEEPSRKPQSQAAPGSDDDTLPIPPQARRLERSDFDINRSKAKPVDEKKENFDWDKFFNDDI